MIKSKTSATVVWCAAGLSIGLLIDWGTIAFAEEDAEITTTAETLAPGVLDADDPVIQNAELMPRAVDSLILDIVETQGRVIAVGERGHILLSDSGRNWRQVEGVPTRSTLTAVTAIATKIWAVGHDGVILHSADSGATWIRQRAAPFDQASDNLQNGAPLLDVYFSDEKNGFAIGAYSQLLVTDDAGSHWTMRNILSKSEADLEAQQSTDNSVLNEENWTFSQEALALEEETDPHFNAITRTGDGSFFIVAERGAAFRSTDGGTSWKRLQMPYQGSMFGVLGFPGRHILCFGLRGNVHESFDLGDTWQKIETGTTLTLMGGVVFAEAGVVLVGANGIVLKRNKDSEVFRASTHPNGNVLASVLALSATKFAIAGETGMSVYSTEP